MRICILADVHNLFHSARQVFSGKVDYSRLLQGIVGDRKLVRAMAYLTSRPDIDQVGFIDALVKSGWEARIKESKIHIDSVNGKKSIVSHPPLVEMTMDALTIGCKNDCVCLVTGDGALTPLALHLKTTGVKVEVFGIEGQTSMDLQKAASNFKAIRPEWIMPDKKFKTKEEANVTSATSYNPDETEEEEKQPVVPNQPALRTL